MSQLSTSHPSPTHVIPSGSLRLDLALGIGGLPRGHFIEICGPASSGKTTLCQHVIAEAQKLGETCAFIDLDHSLDPLYARRCGVHPDRLYVSQPDNAEQALEIVETLVRSGGIAVIALDSLTALVPRAELSSALRAGPGRALPDASQDLLSQSLRRLSNVIHKNDCSILFTNQPRRGISAVYHDLADNPTRLALKLHCAICLELRPLSVIRRQGQAVGERIQVRIVKNSFAPWFDKPELDIMYNDGIVKAGEILDLGLRSAIIQRDGPAYVFQNVRLGTGQEQAIQYLRMDAPLSARIEQAIRHKRLSPP